MSLEASARAARFPVGDHLPVRPCRGTGGETAQASKTGALSPGLQGLASPRLPSRRGVPVPPQPEPQRLFYFKSLPGL